MGIKRTDSTGDSFYLSEGFSLSFDSEVTGTNSNVLVVGTTGCGKTMSVVEPLLLHLNGRSIVVSVTKRILYEMYAPELRRRGYRVVDINLADPATSPSGFDPLAGTDAGTGVNELASKILECTASETDRYWTQAAETVLSAVIRLEIYSAWDEGRRPSFEKVLEAIGTMISREKAGDSVWTSLDGRFEALEGKRPGNSATRAWRNMTATPYRTFMCVISTLNAAADRISGSTAAIFRPEKAADIGMIGEEKTALFVTTAVGKNSTVLPDLLYGEIFSTLYRRAEKNPGGRLRVPVHVVCDDFACGSRIPDFASQLSVFRAKGISVTILLQSESQLSTMYSASEGTTIINNCDTYLYMGGMDPATCRSISERTDRPVDDIMYMPVSRVVVMHRGMKPLWAERYRTGDDPEYRRVKKKWERKKNAA